MIIDISNKVIVITGATGEIGAEVSRALANEGANIVMNYYKNEEKANKLFEEISNGHDNVLKIKGDVRKKEDIEFMYKETLKKFGRVDILINNAGVCDDSPITFLTENKWDYVIDVNLKGTYICSKIFSRNMIKNKKGKIINISSLQGSIGSEEQANYCAAKAGVDGFTKSLAKDLGKFNISVISLSPGFILSNFNKNNIKKIERANHMSVLNNESAKIDLVNFIIYLCSDKIRGISGRCFNLDSRIL